MEEIKTNRLFIRPFIENDIDEIHDLLDVDIKIGKTKRDRRLWLHDQIKLSANNNTGNILGFRAILHNNILVGYCGFFLRLWDAIDKDVIKFRQSCWVLSDHSSFELELGYTIGKQYRRNGYATEASKTIIEYAIKKVGAGRVFALTSTLNTASITTMKKIGMEITYNLKSLKIEPFAQPRDAGVVGIIRHNTDLTRSNNFGIEDKNNRW